MDGLVLDKVLRNAFNSISIVEFQGCRTILDLSSIGNLAVRARSQLNHRQFQQLRVQSSQIRRSTRSFHSRHNKPTSCRCQCLVIHALNQRTNR